MHVFWIMENLRLDKWLWQARFFKSRTLAAKHIIGGKCRVNRQRIKKARHKIQVGDVLTFVQGERIRVIRILVLGVRRGPATEAQTFYEDLDSQQTSNSVSVSFTRASRVSGQGRPTKKDRRALERLKK